MSDVQQRIDELVKGNDPKNRSPSSCKPAARVCNPLKRNCVRCCITIAVSRL